jgi:hypothetical protein
MTHLTVDPWVATVVAVAYPQSVSCGTMLDWRPIMAPSSVAAGGGVLASGIWDQVWIMGKWMLWFGMNRLPDGKTLEKQVKIAGKQKPRRLVERAGFSKKSMICIRSELPACLLGKVILQHAQ